MPCSSVIVVAVLALGPPAPAGAGVGAEPLRAGIQASPSTSATRLQVDGVAPLRRPAADQWSAVRTGPVSPLDRPSADPPPGAVLGSSRGVAPLREVRHVDAQGTAGSTVATPLGRGPAPLPGPPPARRIELVRIEVMVGPVWRIRATEAMTLLGLEFGRLRGFAGAVQGGVIVAPDRDAVAATDFPLGAGFVYRRRFGARDLYGSVGLTAGILVHRAVTERGLLHRVDPDFQLPLRFAWTVGEVGLSVAVLQGFSGRDRTYYRRGAEVWHRIPYRVGFAVGIHFDIGVGRTRPRRSRGP